MSWYNPLSWKDNSIQPNVHGDGIGGINPEYFIPLNSGEYFFDLFNEQDFLRAYKECAPLKSIIGRRAKAFNNGEIELIKTDGTKTKGNYATDSWSKDFLKKLERPNVLQSQDQFFTQHNTYIDIFGYCPVFITRPLGLKSEISSIWNIPPWLFDISYTGKWKDQTTLEGIYKSFTLAWGGERIALSSESLFFVFDDGIGTQEDSNLLIPDSRLTGNEYAVCNIIGTLKSRHTLINNRGASGILSNQDQDAAGKIALDPKEKLVIQNDFKKYGLVGQAFQVIITNANLKWQPMALPTKELMLFEEIVDCTNILLDTYGYPAELFAGVSKGVTFENKKYAKKELYSNTIIPEGNSRIEQFSRGIIPSDKNVKLQRDYSMVDVLQEEEKQKAEAEQAVNLACQTQYNAGLITKNDWREKLGLDRIEQDGFNDYYVAPINNGTVAQ